MWPDRRRKRSTNHAEALRYQLEACADRAEMEAMVVSDDDGLLLAAASPSTNKAEEIAALLPLLARRGDWSGTLIGHNFVAHRISVRSFDIEGVTLFVGAVGGKRRTVGDELALAMSGVTRILN